MWTPPPSWDLWVMHWINGTWHSPWADTFFALISDFDFFRIPLLLLALYLGIWGGFRGRAFLAVALLGLLMGGALVGTIKKESNRPRPYQAVVGVRHVTLKGLEITQESKPNEGGKSFVSGHAANNVSLVFFATAFWRRWARLLWLWPLLISYSRLYLGVHYFSDVVGGWIVALAYSWIILYAMEWLWKVGAPRLCPHVYKAHPELVARSSPLPQDKTKAISI